MSDKNFGQLGISFQQGLLKTIIEDKKFAITIIDVIDSKYFDGPYFRYLMTNIKELYDLYKVIPNYDTLQQKILVENTDSVNLKVHLDTLKSIKEYYLEDDKYIKDTSLKFCRQQVVKKALKESEEIIRNGAFEEYDRIENIITKALQTGISTEDIEDITDNILESLQKEARIPYPTGIDGLDALLKGGISKGELGIVLAPTGIGKELPISEPVLTPKGWVKNGELKIGDEIIGSDGKKQYVLGVYPQGVKPIYKVEFTDKTFVNCGLDHLWVVSTLNRRVNNTNDKNPNYSYKIVSTSDMMSDIKKGSRYNYKLPIVKPIQFENHMVLIDPYLLGIILSNKCLSYSSDINVSIKDDEIFENIKHLDEQISFNQHYKSDVQITHKLSLKSIIEKLKIYNLLDKISNNKFIPKEYIYNSIDVRLSVLQGLMDIDGHINKNGTLQISTISKDLSENIREIVLSLGGIIKINTKTQKNRKLSYILTFSFDNNIIPFRLLNKINSYRTKARYFKQKYVKSIKYSHDEEALCIKVSNEDQLYVTRDYVLTHNTTILTKFANSAYNYGATVLHVVFEDNIKEIRKKHYTIWTEISSDDQLSKQDDVISLVEKITKDRKNRLLILKLPPFGVSISDIRNRLRKLESQNVKIDMLVLDYVDCISMERTIEGEEWKGEGTIMRSLEGMGDEFNIAVWTATQGNRESINSDIVTTDQMGGSIKKAQVGHVVISIAKSLSQKENNLANITLLKSRIGKDGVVFQNCIFDNEYLKFDTESQNTLLGHEEERSLYRKQHAADVYRERLERESKIRNEIKSKKEEHKDTQLEIEAAICKTITEKEETLNQLQNLEQTNQSISNINLETIDIKNDNIILTSKNATSINRASEVYKMRKQKVQASKNA